MDTHSKKKYIIFDYKYKKIKTINNKNYFMKSNEAFYKFKLLMLPTKMQKE